MNEEQEKFFDEVIKPKLIEMAINCTLPTDMNDINSFDFENEAKEFNHK